MTRKAQRPATMDSALAIVALAATAVLALPGTASAQLRVIISGGFSAAYQKLLPEFERTSGLTVTTTHGASQGNGPNTIGAQLRNRAPVDVVIMNRAGLDELIAEGRIAAGTDADIAQTSLGVAIHAGSPKPDIGTLDAFKATLLRAKSVTIDSSTSAIYLRTKLFSRLGIANEMAGKTLPENAGAIANGKAEIGVLPVSEILPFKDVVFAGKIPAEAQDISVFAAAAVARTKQRDAAQRLIAFLASQTATPAIEQSGMERPKRR